MSISEFDALSGGGNSDNVPFIAILELDQLRQRCLGNEQLVMQILSKIDRTVSTECQRLRAAIDQADFETVAALAHRLKGTAANIGAERFKLVAKQLELWARQSEPVRVQEYFLQLQDERERLCTEIKAIITDGTAPSHPQAEVTR